MAKEKMSLARMQSLFDSSATIISNTEKSVPNVYCAIAVVANNAAKLLKSDSSIEKINLCNKALREQLRNLRAEMRDYARLQKARKLLQSLGDEKLTGGNSANTLAQLTSRLFEDAKAKIENELIEEIDSDDDEELDYI